MRNRLYIPPEVRTAISEHIAKAVPKAVEGYISANEDEDTLTGQFGGVLRTGQHRVLVSQSQMDGEWKWSIDYCKFRGRGKRATENIIGADGILELRLQLGSKMDVKSLLFQAKNDWDSDPALVKQCIKMSTWHEAAFVLNYTSTEFQAYSLDEVLRSRGNKRQSTRPRSLGEFLSGDFLQCSVGSTDLIYEPRGRRLIWRAKSGEVVATQFPLRHRIRFDVKAPPTPQHNPVDMHIPHSEIHRYRMDAQDDEILSLNADYSVRELKTARKQLALIYHPDKYGIVDMSLWQILERRMQEINAAYDTVRERLGCKK